MPRNPLHEVAIVGVYNTPQAKQLTGWTEPALLVDAMRGGLANAGLGPKDVDGVNAHSWVWRMSSREGAHLLGKQPCWTGQEPGIGGVLEAAAAIATAQELDPHQALERVVKDKPSDVSPVFWRAVLKTCFKH